MLRHVLISAVATTLTLTTVGLVVPRGGPEIVSSGPDAAAPARPTAGNGPDDAFPRHASAARPSDVPTPDGTPRTPTAGSAPPPSSAAPSAAPTSSASPRSGAPGPGTAAEAGPLASVRSAVRSAPMSGPGWRGLLDATAGDLGEVDLADQDSTSAARTYGVALVHLRTGERQYRDKVVRQLQQLPGSATPPRDPGGTRGGVLSVARQLSGYLMAAELIGYRDRRLIAFARDVRDREIGGHGRWDSIATTSADTANNWGTWSLATRIAIDTYIDDRADLRVAASIFERYTGASSTFGGWTPSDDFDASWACDPERYTGINPASCGDRSGAMVEDISRSSGSYPRVDGTGVAYSYEALGGSIISAKLLHDAGYRDVYRWGDRALLRAAQFLDAHADGQPPRHPESRHIPWAVDRIYDTRLARADGAGYGWALGFTDWVF